MDSEYRQHAEKLDAGTPRRPRGTWVVRLLVAFALYLPVTNIAWFTFLLLTGREGVLAEDILPHAAMVTFMFWPVLFPVLAVPTAIAGAVAWKAALSSEIAARLLIAAVYLISAAAVVAALMIPLSMVNPNASPSSVLSYGVWYAVVPAGLLATLVPPARP